MYGSNLKRKIERHREFYSRHEPGDPLVYMRNCATPRLATLLCSKLHALGQDGALAAADSLAEEYVASLRNSLKRFYEVDDDSVPAPWVYWGIGGITAAMTGLDPTFDGSTSWLEPNLSWAEIDKLRIDLDNKWILFARDLNRALWARWEEDFLLLPFLHRSPLDAANGIRGTELFLEMYSDPDKVASLVEWCADWSIAVEKFLKTEAPRPKSWGVGVWGAWLPDDGVFVNGDPVGLISAQHADEFDRPYTEKLFTSTGGGLFHNHTVGIHQAELVSSYKGIVLQWFIDDPKQPSFASALLDMPELRDRLIAASLQSPVAGTVPHDHLKRILDIARQGRFILSVSCPDNTDLSELLKRARAHSR